MSHSLDTSRLEASRLETSRLDTSHLAPAAAECLAHIAERRWSEDFYLAGSAALALYRGHRRVRDLDLMGINRLSSPQRRDLLGDVLSFEPAVRVETARDGFLYLRWPGDESRWPGKDGGAVRLFYYPYPLVDSEREVAGRGSGVLAVASPIDLGLMKLGAIISRAGRRDFVDLYLLCQQVPLALLLDRASDKFGHVLDFPLQALKGLADLDWARKEPMPLLDLDLEWSQVEAWLDGEVRQLSRVQVGLSTTTEESE